LFILFGVTLAASFFWFLKPGRLDIFVSNSLSRTFHLNAKCSGVRIDRWPKIYFKSATIGRYDQSGMIRSGAGEVIIETSANLFDIDVREVAIDANRWNLLKSMPWPEGFLKNGGFEIHRLHFLLKGRGAHKTIHVLTGNSDDFSIKGGGQFLKQKITKGHLWVEMSPFVWKRLPEEFAKRMKKGRDDSRIFHLVFHENVIKLLGNYGPFFEARWQG